MGFSVCATLGTVLLFSCMGCSWCFPLWDCRIVLFLGCYVCFPLLVVLTAFLYGMLFLFSFTRCSYCLAFMRCSYCFPLWVGLGAFGGRSLRISHMLNGLNLLELLYILNLLSIVFIRGRSFKVFLIFVSSSCHSTLILCKSIKIDKQKTSGLVGDASFVYVQDC